MNFPCRLCSGREKKQNKGLLRVSLARSLVISIGAFKSVWCGEGNLTSKVLCNDCNELQTPGSSKPSVLCTVTCPRCWRSSYTLRTIQLTINTRVNEVSAHKGNLRLRLALRTKDSFIKHYEEYMMFYYDSSSSLFFFLFMWAYASFSFGHV